jgi:hypothetical protein
LARTYVRLLGPCFKTGRTGGRRGRRGHRRALVSPTAFATAAGSAGTCEQVPTCDRTVADGSSERLTPARLRSVSDSIPGEGSPATRARAGGKRGARRLSTSTRAPRRPARIGRGAYRREVRRSFALRHDAAPARLSLWRRRGARSIERLILGGSRRLRPFSSKRFHALLNSLFKVLFNFPSRYLFAIGLVVVFSLRRGLPPA